MKKTLALILALILAFSLVACSGGEDEKKPSGGDQPSGGDNKPSEGDNKPSEGDQPSGGDAPADLPTEDGKVTYYATIKDGIANQGEFVSIYVTGGAFGWATGLGALELQKLGDTNVYYGISEAIPDPASDDVQKFDYQMVLGYNGKSGLGESEQGLQWVDSYKSDVSAAPGGLSNPQFTYNAGDKTVNLGEHSFTATLAAPKKVDVTLTVEFAEPLPEGAELYMFGDINGWAFVEETSKFTSADNKTWTLPLNGVLCKSYSFKLKAFEAGQFNPENIWDGGVEYSDNGNNMSFTVYEIDAGGSISLTASPLTYAPAAALSVTLSVEFAEALPEGSTVCVYGGMNGWAYDEARSQFTSEDNKLWTLALESVNAEVVEFKVKVYAEGELNTGDIWAGGVEYAGADGANATVDLTNAAAGDTVPLFPEPLPAPSAE